MYLGLPLLVTVVAFVVAFRRRSILVLAAAVAVCTWVLSLGGHLTIDRHITSVPLPFDVLLHLPVVQDMLPVRFSLLTALFTSAVLALGLDMLRHRIGDRSPKAPLTAYRHSHRGGGSRWLGSAVALVVACVVALSLLPRSAYGTAATDIPPFFTTDAVQRIPVGSTVLTYPYPVDPQLQGMLDQAVAGMRYKITGGYGFVPDATGHSTFGPSAPAPARGAAALLLGVLRRGDTGRRPARPVATAVPAMRTYLATVQRVDRHLLRRGGRTRRWCCGHMTAAIGPPTTDHGHDRLVRRAGPAAGGGAGLRT